MLGPPESQALPLIFYKLGKYVFKFTCTNCGGGDRGRVAIYRPFGEFCRANIALSPVWCSRPTTGVPLAHATMNFVGLDLTPSDRYFIRTRAFKLCHEFSIGSRSGLLPGQDNNSMILERY
ncbi:hypothetical protein TNCV_1540491 [Trichonephila clavipes]|nr:hypothetical protein TNCV_1540491 [Trichonephila clavipes]